MSLQLKQLLTEARLDHFVGREEERALFEQAVADDVLPFHLLHVYGPGGVGKTSLLRSLDKICSRYGCARFWLDGHAIDPTPTAFLTALRDDMRIAPTTDPLAVMAQMGRCVLFVDTFEALEGLEGWLRQSFLPDIPADLLVVTASRNLLPAPFRMDAGWQQLLRTIPLRNLPPDASRALLRRRAVPRDQHDRALAFTYGHPLALTLVADLYARRPDLTFAPEDEPTLIHTLLHRFLDEVTQPALLDALQVAALVRFLTEPMLATVLDLPSAREAFEWVRAQSFVEAQADGLYVHDIARSVLLADLRWRDPERYDTLHQQLRTYFTRRLQTGSPVQQAHLLTDYFYLYRDHPVVRPFFLQLRGALGVDGAPAVTPFTPDDTPVLLDLVRRHEGDQAQGFAAQWMEAQPGGIRVFRTEDDTITGFMHAVDLNTAPVALREADPASHAVWHDLNQRAALRGQERAVLFRFWMSAQTHQDVSVEQSLFFIETVRFYLTTPNLAYTFLPCAQPAFWKAVLTFAGMQRLEAADYQVGGHTYGVFGHDWRTEPPSAWLHQIAQRGEAETEEPPPAAIPIAVLDRATFDAAVHDSLRDFAGSNGLDQNPLLRSRLVIDLATEEEEPPLAMLRALLRTAVKALDSDAPSEQKYYRALHHTYIQPAPSQMLAAERIGVPFSTYRRHLQRGVQCVADRLWQLECGGTS